MHALWALAVPIRVIIYTRFALQIVRGRAVGWSTMRRAGTPSPLRRRFRLYWPHVLTGTATSIALAWTHSWALWWLAPVLAG
jgi:membrane glycosyltransferase